MAVPAQENSDLSDACANAPAMRSNRFFNCTSMCAATDAPDVGHPSLRTRRRFFPISGSEELEKLLASFRDRSADQNGKMSIVRVATEVPGTGRPSLPALWDAMELAIGTLCRSVSAGIGQIGVLSSFPMRPETAPRNSADSSRCHFHRGRAGEGMGGISRKTWGKANVFRNPNDGRTRRCNGGEEGVGWEA